MVGLAFEVWIVVGSVVVVAADSMAVCPRDIPVIPVETNEVPVRSWPNAAANAPMTTMVQAAIIANSNLPLRFRLGSTDPSIRPHCSAAPWAVRTPTLNTRVCGLCGAIRLASQLIGSRPADAGDLGRIYVGDTHRRRAPSMPEPRGVPQTPTTPHLGALAIISLRRAEKSALEGRT